MTDEMPSSRRYLSSAGRRISSFRGYLSSLDSRVSSPRPSGSHVSGPSSSHQDRQSWRAWAGEKIKARRKGVFENTEIVNVFPGWASRRFTVGSHGGDEGPRPFDLEVFVSGYAISYRPPENASRAQRAFIRVAKGFASLPKLVDNLGDIAPNSSALAVLTPSTEELLSGVVLPPRPEEITDDYDVDALEQQLQRAKQTADDDGYLSDSSVSSQSSRSSFHARVPLKDRLPSASHTPARGDTMTPNEAIRQLHANLEQRLQPFWSSTLPHRIVRLHLFASPHKSQSMEKDQETVDRLLNSENGPIASQDVCTTADGSFLTHLKVKWEQLCHHPTALHIAFGEDLEEHDMLVVAQLLPNKNRSQQNLTVLLPGPPVVPLTSLSRIPITNSPVRVISDIDDTIKFSGVLAGARTLFHNVFVKDLKEGIIPGMGEWYTMMFNRGVRFHYVSNGPFELLPILNEFMELSSLPPGSIKLRSYAGRSLFNGLLSAPASRKRAGVVDVLDAFPDSRFILIGDTGEQDLELYADIARERPDQVLAVFVRDADATTSEPLQDPTGWNAIEFAGTRTSNRPLASRSDTASSGVSRSSTGSLSQYKFYENNIAMPNPNKTPRPNINTFIDSNALLSSEPEGFDSMATPTLPRNERVKSDDTIRHSSLNSNNSPLTSSLASRMKIVDTPPKPIPPPSVHGLTPRTASLRSQQSDISSGSSVDSEKKKLTDLEKRRIELQLRVYRARTQMPSHVPLRVFQNPEECIEAEDALERDLFAKDEPIKPPTPLFWSR
ncbi:hypothetical protein D9619_006504 [Psilocybe cf. subviscida]|uniref:Phosphatidate phosphatase APP1 catalytic domain-containing protein n=1 Tax=Psilocybe cf. subviscida TaxID=2480587 RepID=A0A8H5B4Z3_9AGAR|nr:hypothetical protein D9619_006504 [Psilocybe cf. subviscida]